MLPASCSVNCSQQRECTDRHTDLPPWCLLPVQLGCFFVGSPFCCCCCWQSPFLTFTARYCFFSFVLVRAFKVWVMECKSMGKNGKQHLHMVFRVVSLASVEWDQHACIAKTKKSFHSQMCMLQVPHFSVRWRCCRILVVSSFCKACTLITVRMYLKMRLLLFWGKITYATFLFLVASHLWNPVSFLCCILSHDAAVY